METPTLSLYELNSLLRNTIELVMCDEYWVRAEVLRVSESRGHCYLELVEKDERGNGIVAKANGTIWASRWGMLRMYFERTTGQRLTAGMQVLVRAKVTFHELYGFSLNISDIDPTFTLGGIAKRRQEILRQLEEEGVIDMNKELPLPRLLQRIAVVSSASAAGYGDFCNQLHGNKRGLAFHTELFQAVMQGNDVERSVIGALTRIAERMDEWDAVVIIRGGGAVVDLAGFDSLALAEHVAQFPLPIITGIGHERDDTVIDLVAHTRVKTPTAAAELLIHHQEDELNAVESMAERIMGSVAQTLQREDARLKMLTSTVPTLYAKVKAREEIRLSNAMMTMRHGGEKMIGQRSTFVEMMSQQFTSAAWKAIDKQTTALEKMAAHIDAANPERILRLGYSIARVGGKTVKDATMLKEGDVLETTFAKGVVKSIVNKTPPQPSPQGEGA